MHHVDVQKTPEQPELMEVVDSPPERAFTELPTEMEIGGEENAKIFLLGSRVKLSSHSVQTLWKS